MTICAGGQSPGPSHSQLDPVWGQKDSISVPRLATPLCQGPKPGLGWEKGEASGPEEGHWGNEFGSVTAVSALSRKVTPPPHKMLPAQGWTSLAPSHPPWQLLLYPRAEPTLSDIQAISGHWVPGWCSPSVERGLGGTEWGHTMCPVC
jgi:hypothetical protein